MHNKWYVLVVIWVMCFVVPCVAQSEQVRVNYSSCQNKDNFNKNFFSVLRNVTTNNYYSFNDLILSARYSPKSKLFALAYRSGEIEIFDICDESHYRFRAASNGTNFSNNWMFTENGEQIIMITKEDGKSINELPSRENIFDTPTLRVLNARSGEIIFTEGISGSANLQFIPERNIYMFKQASSFWFFDINKLDFLPTQLQMHEYVHNYEYDSIGKQTIFTANRTHLGLWKIFFEHGHPKLKKIKSKKYSDLIKYFPIKVMQKRGDYFQDIYELICCFYSLPRQNQILTISTNGVIRIWGARNLEHIRQHHTGFAYVKYVNFFPKKNLIAIIGYRDRDEHGYLKTFMVKLVKTNGKTVLINIFEDSVKAVEYLPELESLIVLDPQGVTQIALDEEKIVRY